MVVIKSKDELIKEASQKMFDELDGLSQAKDQDISKMINVVEGELSKVSKFYDENPTMNAFRKQKKEEWSSMLNTTNKSMYNLFDYECESPFSVVNILLNLNASDYILHKKIINIQFGKEFHVIRIPENLEKIFGTILAHVLNNQKFINGSKLDVSQPSLDTTFKSYRMNMLHESISSVGSPTIAIRKHTLGVQENKSVASLKEEKYFESIGASEQQIKTLMSLNKESMIIFGDTGSGKTTLLRFISNHNLDEKRNLCVIEDAAELGLDVPISLITNGKHTIHEMYVHSLRFNPSQLIIGETRTDEIVDILESALTFPVYTTIHASTFNKALERIFFMSLNRKIDKSVIDTLIAASVDVFVMMEDYKLVGMWKRNDVLDANTPLKEKYDEIK